MLKYLAKLALPPLPKRLKDMIHGLQLEAGAEAEASNNKSKKQQSSKAARKSKISNKNSSCRTRIQSRRVNNAGAKK